MTITHEGAPLGSRCLTCGEVEYPEDFIYCDCYPEHGHEDDTNR